MKKKILTILITLVMFMCVFALAACEGDKDFFGIYSDPTTTIEIGKNGITINNKLNSYSYNEETNELEVDGYAAPLSFYEQYNVLSFNILLNFDSGSISQRDGEISTSLYKYGNGGILEAYNFNENGTYTYINSLYTNLNSYGTYKLKNGVMKLENVSVLTLKTSETYWYIADNGEIHYGVLIKNPQLVYSKNKSSASLIGVEYNKYSEFGVKLVVADKYCGKVVEEIKEDCFINGSNIIKIKLGDGIKIIKDRAFFGCVNLEELNLSTNLKIIGELAFAGCSKLKSIKIPKDVVSIGGMAFNHCQLKELIIPKSVETIGGRLFGPGYSSGCETNIYCEVAKKPNGWHESWASTAKVFWYSDDEPASNADGTAYDGNYWKYADDGEVVVWEYNK